jgi:hypothetical protein
MAMAKWTTSLLLILTLGASVLSGMPLHFNEEKCAMHGMSDCCKTAQGHGEETDVASARVCCAVNCPQPGTSGPSGVQSSRNLTLLSTAIHPALVNPPTPKPIPILVSNWAHSPPQSSNPAYIRNLALLI